MINVFCIHGNSVTHAMDNADLERLKISPGRLVPKFNPTTTQYTVTLSSNVCEVKLTTITSDSGASTTIKVSYACPGGNNH